MIPRPARRIYGVFVWMAAAAACCTAAPISMAAVLTFSEQPQGEGPMNPSVYTSAHGLPAGVTATFSGFIRYDGAFGEQDHSPAGPNRLLYGTSTGGPSTITFNVPVEVPSLWVSTGSFGDPGDIITGTLAGGSRFTFRNDVESSFVEVTAGAGKLVDQIQFSDFAESYVDDLTVTVPEPTPLGLVAALLVVGWCDTDRRRAKFRSPRRPGPLPVYDL